MKFNARPLAPATVFPSLGAYVGGDITAGILATGLDRDRRLRLFIDVGTNCEIAIGNQDRIVATAAPAGPAFEAASIKCGMRAADGAIEIVKLTSRDLQWLPALTNLLIDNVHQGATLGFLAPLSRYQALDYWHGVFARLGQHHALWIACESEGPGRLLGAIQLSLCPLANAHHRGEVQRLMVHSQERSRGVAGQLMARVETAAATQGRFLLQLETCADSQAEAVFTGALTLTITPSGGGALAAADGDADPGGGTDDPRWEIGVDEVGQGGSGGGGGQQGQRPGRGASQALRETAGRLSESQRYLCSFGRS